MPLALPTAASPINQAPTLSFHVLCKHHRVDSGTSIREQRRPGSEYETHTYRTSSHPAKSTQHAATMSEATLKPEKDFSKEVDQQLPEAEALAKVTRSLGDPSLVASVS